MLLPWIAHVYTGLGAVLALVAARAVFADDVRGALLLFVAATVIDATDGALARAVRVKERLPSFDGARLDDIVDYLTYVFVPVLLFARNGLLPPAWAVPVGACVLLASAYGFGHTEAKIRTSDHFFTGFPSYWNVAAGYLVVWGFSPETNAAILIVLAVLVLVPVRYVYPSRTDELRALTLTLGISWAVLFTVMVWRLPATDGPWMTLSLVFPVYYFALSLWLNVRSRTGHGRTETRN